MQTQQVSAVMGGKISSGANNIYQRSLDAAQEQEGGAGAGAGGATLTRRMVESQGPVDWSSTGLKYKYRTEVGLGI